MRRFFIALFLFVGITPCLANVTIDPGVVTEVIKESFPEDKVNDTIREYNAQMRASAGKGISAAKLWNVCVAGGLDIKSPDGKKKCYTFVNTMVKRSKISYYEVCGRHKGKTGGTEYCVDDFFSDFIGGIQVQMLQAVELGKEYARVKHNDSSVQCKSKPREGAVDDMVQCSSRDKNAFYEFVFDDVLETKDNTIATDVLEAVCKIHGLKYVERGVAPGTMYSVGVSWPDLCETTDAAKCNAVNVTAKKFGYSAAIGKALSGNKCILSRNVKTRYFAYQV